jgi:hypothetical protein
LAASVLLCAAGKGIILETPLAETGFAFGGLTFAACLLGAALLLAGFLAGLMAAVGREAPRLRRLVTLFKRRDLVFCVALLAALNIFAWLYIKNSHTIYYWDNAGYWTNTHLLAETVRQHGVAVLLRDVYTSVLTSDYNSLIALPWVPLVLLFGTSRWVFVAGIVNLAVYPIFLLLFAFIKARSRRAVFVTSCVVCCLPMLFYTALVGFIDVAGVVFTLLATLFWLSDKNENEAGRYLLIGCLLAFSILLRRWLAFFAVSFFIALLVDAIFFKKRTVPVLTAFFSFAFTLMFLFQPFVTGRLLRSYSDAYAAYKSAVTVDFHYFFYYFGIAVAALALAGGIWLCAKRDTRRQGVFLLLQPVLCFCLFVQVQTHGQQHLLLYFPAFCALISTAFCRLGDGMKKQTVYAALMTLAALIPAVNPFLMMLRPDAAKDLKTLAALPSFNYIPPARSDADTLVSIVRYLDQIVGAQGKTVGILASSFALNKDQLLNAEASLGLGRISDVDRSYIAWLPEVDSRDEFPGNLFYCDYYLVADPVQLHLGEGNQECIMIPASELLSGDSIGVAVEPIGGPYFVGYDGGITVRLYVKSRDFTENEKKYVVDAYNSSKK